MRNLIVMFVTAVCFLFLLKLKWPKNRNFYGDLTLYYGNYVACLIAMLQLMDEKHYQMYVLHFPLDQDLLVSLNAYKPQIELGILPTDCQKWLREFGRRALFDQSISIKLEEFWNGTEEKCDEDIF